MSTIATDKTLILYGIKIVIILLLCTLVLFALYVNAKQDAAFPSPSYGVPSASLAEIDTSRSSIDQIVSCETQLFILYDENRGIVKTYDLHGNHQQTLLFYAHQNGAFRIRQRTVLCLYES